MRKFLGTLVIVAVIVAAVGFYRGWFYVQTDNQPGETNVELKIDKEKIRQDTQEAAAKASQLGAQGGSADNSSDGTEK